MSADDIPDDGRSVRANRPIGFAIADVLAVLHGEEYALPAGRYAVSLAAAFGAHLTVAGLSRDPSRQFYLAQAPAAALAAALSNSLATATALADQISAMATDSKVASTQMVLDVEIGHGWAEVAQLARLFDITILARPTGADAERDEALVETLLLQSGRASIVVPPSYSGPASFARPIIAWDGSRGAARALAQAMPLLRYHGEAQIVTVVGQHDSRTVPDIIPHIERHGVACTYYTPAASPSVAKTLLAHARRAASDLLVMGAFSHSRLREFVLGGTTRDILMAANLPVLFAS
jgi:nucleotide-binding universal stress UspA family protein